MRAMKRTVSVVLALVMVLGMMTMAISASAAETNQITATSNFADSYSVDYNANANQVTVTYTFKTALKVVNFEGTATYDSSVLQLSEATFPGFNGEATANTEEYENTIYVNASNTNGYDFTGDGVAIANLVFNIVGTGNTTVNFDINEMTATTAAGSGEANDVDVFDESVATGDQAYTATATVTTDVPDVNVKDYFKSHSLNLRGKVGVNFNCLIPSEYANNECKVVLSSDVGEDVTTILGPDNYESSRGYYVCTYTVRSIDLTRPITAKYYVDGAFVVEEQFSAKDYITAWLAAYPSDTNKTTALVKRLAYYGAKAQIYFATQRIDTNVDYLANEGIDYTAPTITADDITATMQAYPTLTDIGVSKVNMNLTLDADTSLNVPLTISDKAKLDATTLKIDGVEVNYTMDTVGRAVLSKTDIASNAYAKDYVFDFGNGKTYTASVHTYLKKVLAANFAQEFKDLCMATYAYGLAADNAFGAAK